VEQLKVLILSEAEFETSTEEVMDCLLQLGALPLRLNGEDLDSRGATVRFEICEGNANARLWIEDKELQLNEVQAVWYRRWVRNRQHEVVDLLDSAHANAGRLHYAIKRHLTLESRRLSSFLFSRLAGVPWLSDPEKASINKLHVLEVASKVGLATPATLITSERQEVRRFSDLYGLLITKPMGEVEILIEGENVHFMFTPIIDREAIDALPERFTPSLFQEWIEKDFELRIFYIDGDCYAMAIFSQLNPQSQADFRRQDFTRPNRYVPYRLSSETTDRVRRLMEKLGLDTGSLDLIRMPGGREVFLEVNPIGQFGMVSKPCNYQLERRMAEALIRRATYGQGSRQ